MCQGEKTIIIIIADCPTVPIIMVWDSTDLNVSVLKPAHTLVGIQNVPRFAVVQAVHVGLCGAVRSRFMY